MWAYIHVCITLPLLLLSLLARYLSLPHPFLLPQLALKMYKYVNGKGGILKEPTGCVRAISVSIISPEIMFRVCICVCRCVLVCARACA